MILGRLFGGSKSEQEGSGNESDLEKQYRREQADAGKQELADGLDSSDYEGLDDWIEDWQGVEREGKGSEDREDHSSDDDDDGGEMMPILNF